MGSLIGDYLSVLLASSRVTPRRLESVCCLKHLLTYALISLSLCRRNSLTSHLHRHKITLYLILKLHFAANNIILYNYPCQVEEFENK